MTELRYNHNIINVTKTAIITGGMRGIGLAYCKALLDRNYCIAIFDLIIDNDIIAELRNTYGNIIEGYEVDVSNKEHFIITYEIAKCDLAHGINHYESDVVIDVLVLNAGIYGFLFEKSEEIIQTNLLHAINGTEMLLKDVTKGLATPAGKDVLVAITTSTNGIIPADSDFAPVYVASKFALNGFVYAMKPFAERFSVRVNAIAPVSVRTPMVESLGINDDTVAYLNDENRGGIMEPHIVAEGLLKLIDDKSIAGEIITIHPNNDKGGRREGLDPSGRFDYLGLWSESKSAAVKTYVNQAVQAVQDDPSKALGWSKVKYSR